MLPVLRKVKGIWFLGDFCGHVTSKDIFHCIDKSCPYSVKMHFSFEGGKKMPTSIDKVLCGLHCHAFPENKKYANKRIVELERALVVSGNDPEGVIEAKLKEWQEEARAQSKTIVDKLLAIETAVDYASKHPHLSGRDVEEQYPEMKRQAIDMARLRQMKKQGRVTNLDDLIQNRSHHLLKNNGDEILVFGLETAVGIMASTNLILADRTFKCVLAEFSQLYIFHAVVKKNVSLPMLFCLVKWKDDEVYRRLLVLVEELAEDSGRRIFNRLVTLMCDFEATFIDVVKDNFETVNVKCCFYFTKNIKTHACPVMTLIRRIEGKTSEAYAFAPRTKRRLMMLPLLPERTVSPGVVHLILRAWQDNCPQHRDVFDGLVATIIHTYVGTRSSTPVNPRFPSNLWCVSGLIVRTNNARKASIPSSIQR